MYEYFINLMEDIDIVSSELKENIEKFKKVIKQQDNVLAKIL